MSCRGPVGDGCGSESLPLVISRLSFTLFSAEKRKERERSVSDNDVELRKAESDGEKEGTN